jgi:hypothetical protein
MPCSKREDYSDLLRCSVAAESAELGEEGGPVISTRRLEKDCAVCDRPSTGGFVTSMGSGTGFCCTALLVQPTTMHVATKPAQPMRRSLRLMSGPIYIVRRT